MSSGICVGVGSACKSTRVANGTDDWFQVKTQNLEENVPSLYI